ncbi:Nob1p [Sugiyamaella lignohabitans]|uniref:20S-pre-rRNA D-site endonuclease NOB1 n=1 Tax=Sugiyamaella lignohabitans TaxID=796027 RepID=A0A161HIM1_9ASCO|nr:Nob1p [Sugiyamaella lignohabitans]ANB11028.1 Nob1p [Sugiyamaella lignohabitans]
MASINSLILDAGPLLTQTFSDLHSRAEKFFTTPSVYNEIKDERARQNLLLWGEELVVRQPKPSSIAAVSEFSKKTGDYAVLSSTDMHILALCYELEVELNGGDWRLRKVPGQKNINGAKEVKHSETQKSESTDSSVSKVKESNEQTAEPVSDLTKTESKKESSETTATEPEANPEETEDDGWSVVAAKPRKQKKGKKRNDLWSKPAQVPVIPSEPTTTDSAQPESEVDNQQITEATATEESQPPAEENVETQDSFVEEIIEEDYDDEDADDWITTENLQETLEKAGGDKLEKVETKTMKAAMSTGDFAMQNVALQMGLNLVNPTNGKHIKRVKNYMLRCHACFKLTAFPKDGRPRQFCPRCGGATLLRCTVQVSDSGNIQVFLKKNMQWSSRGDKFSLPTPQSRNARKQRHESDPILLREDQKEYQKAVKDSMWKKRQNEKLLDEWIGTGSADSVGSPFAISGYKRDATKHTGVRVGRGRYVNDSKRK